MTLQVLQLHFNTFFKYWLNNCKYYHNTSFVTIINEYCQFLIFQKGDFFFSEECSNKGGVNAGSCASGFGVCCTCKYIFLQFCIISMVLIIYLLIKVLEVQSLPLESAFYTVFLAISLNKRYFNHCTISKLHPKVGYTSP